jgi:flagellar motor switch protein FliN
MADQQQPPVPDTTVTTEPTASPPAAAAAAAPAPAAAASAAPPSDSAATVASEPAAPAAAPIPTSVPSEPSASPAPTASSEPASAAAAETSDASDQAAMDELLKQASFEDVVTGAVAASAPGPAAEAAVADVASAAAVAAPPPDTMPFELPSFQQVMQDAQASGIELLRDVELNVKIELGRSRMLVEDVLKLAEGSVVELDKLAGDPVDVFVNDRLVARGEVLVLNDNFCVRVNEIVAGLKEEGL